MPDKSKYNTSGGAAWVAFVAINERSALCNLCQVIWRICEFADILVNLNKDNGTNEDYEKKAAQFHHLCMDLSKSKTGTLMAPSNAAKIEWFISNKMMPVIIAYNATVMVQVILIHCHNSNTEDAK